MSRASTRLMYRSWKFERKKFGVTLAELPVDSLSRTLSVNQATFKNPFRENMKLESAMAQMHWIQKSVHPELYVERDSKTFFKTFEARYRAIERYQELGWAIPEWPAEVADEEEVCMKSENSSEEEDMGNEDADETASFPEPVFNIIAGQPGDENVDESDDQMEFFSHESNNPGSDEAQHVDEVAHMLLLDNDYEEDASVNSNATQNVDTTVDEDVGMRDISSEEEISEVEEDVGMHDRSGGAETSDVEDRMEGVVLAFTQE
jgi:hypothetical protein